MELYLGVLLFSFVVTSIAIVPFIDFLYRLRLTHRAASSGLTRDNSTASRHLHKLHLWKEGTPVGGGILIIPLVSVLYLFTFLLISRLGIYITSGFPLKEELNVIFFTFVSFGLLGLYDDLVKIFPSHLIRFPLFSGRPKYIIQAALSLFIAVLLYQNLKINIINFPSVGVVHLGWLYIPFAASIIFGFSQAFDYSDGLDGLAAGLLFICLLAFWFISVAALDTPISLFIALWLGSLLAFLYFNIYPARIWLGNTGSVSFGATLAVIALILGKSMALFVVGGLFILNIATSVSQYIAVHTFKKRLFPIAPLHHWLQIIGWPEPKIVLRAWLLGLMLAVFGLWLAGS